MFTQQVVNEVVANRISFRNQGGWVNRLLDGTTGPEAILAFGPSVDVRPHLHFAAQFHIFLKGVLRAPSYETPAIGVLYTDHGVPYGPWLTDNNLVDLVLHANQTGESTEKDPDSRLMRNPAARKMINHGGRYFMVSASTVAPEPTPDGGTRQVLFQEPSGLSAIVYTCPPGATFKSGGAPHGRFEVIAKGSALADGKRLDEYGLRFVKGDEAPAPLKIGPQGATIGVLTFDQDAEVPMSWKAA